MKEEQLQLELKKEYKSSFKDKCDIYKQFGYCSGINGKVVCEKCKKK